MRLRTYVGVCALILACCAARADETAISFAAAARFDDALEGQQQELDELQGELASARREYQAMQQPPAQLPPQTFVAPPFVPAAITWTPDVALFGGWYGFGEALIVQPFHSEGVITPAAINCRVTPRITLGWTGDSGFGVRVRYWGFDAYAADGVKFDNELHAHTGDIEFTDRIFLGNWIVTGFVGGRYVSFINKHFDPFFNPPLLQFRTYYEGFGATTGIDLLRPFCDHFSFYCNGRVSVVMGVSDLYVAPQETDPDRDIREIVEVGTGVQYDRVLDCGLHVFGRAGVEAQYWAGFSSSQVVAAGITDFGFAGLTLGGGVCY